MSNPIVAAIVAAGQPQFMAVFLAVVFLCAGHYLLRQPRTPEKVFGLAAAGIGFLVMIPVFIGTKLYIEACATDTSVRLPGTVWGATLLGFVAMMVTCAHCLRGGLLQSSAAVATGCGILLSGSSSLVVGCGALHLGAKAAGYKALVALFEVTAIFTAIFIVGFIVSVSFPVIRRLARKVAAKKKAKV